MLKEDATPANVTGDGIANPSNNVLNLKKSRFMNLDVFEVDHEVYCNCLDGKRHGDRWDKYVLDEPMRDALKKEFYKGNQLLVQSALTKSMVYLRK